MHAGPGVRSAGLGIRNVFGMHGLGQSDAGNFSDGIGIDPTSGSLVTDLGLSLPLTPITLPALTLPPFDYASGLPDNPPIDPNLINALATSAAGYGTTGVSTSNGGSLSAAQIASIIGNSANAAVGIFKATSSPSVIAGTGLVYNPATGQLVNATTGFGVAGVGAALGSYLPLLLVVGAAVLILPMLSGGKR